MVSGKNFQFIIFYDPLACPFAYCLLLSQEVFWGNVFHLGVSFLGVWAVVLGIHVLYDSVFIHIILFQYLFSKIVQY